MASLNTSLRNTGWRHIPKINLPKSDISPERLYHSRSRFSKNLTVSIEVSWNRKTNIFFINPQKTKLTRTVTSICWRLPYCLNVVDNDFEFSQNSVPSHRAKVTQQFLRQNHGRLYNSIYYTDVHGQNTPDFIAADEWASYSPYLNPLNTAFGIFCRIWCTKAEDFRLQVYRTWKRQSKTSGRSPLRQLKNRIEQWRNDWMWLESRMEARFNTFSANRCDWISISSFSCSETCWTYWLLGTFRTSNTLLRISLSKQKRITS